MKKASGPLGGDWWLWEPDWTHHAPYVYKIKQKKYFKTVPPQQSFSSCCGAFDHITYLPQQMDLKVHCWHLETEAGKTTSPNFLPSAFSLEFFTFASGFISTSKDFTFIWAVKDGLYQCRKWKKEDKTAIHMMASETTHALSVHSLCVDFLPINIWVDFDSIKPLGWLNYRYCTSILGERVTCLLNFTNAVLHNTTITTLHPPAPPLPSHSKYSTEQGASGISLSV